MSQSIGTSPPTKDQSRPGRLRGGAIGALGAAVLAMAFMGPATSVAFNTPPAAAKIGFALPFGILLAMLVCLIMASTIGAFSSKLPSAGFAYTFNTHAFGKGTGFTSGWILVLAYGAVGPMLFAAMGGFGNQFLVSQWNLNIPWWVISAVIMAIIWFIGSRGISSSAKTALIFLTLEVGVLLSLFVTIIGKGGASGNTIAPFNPAHSLTGVSGIGFGMLWGILMFVGFESAGTLGEETRDPKRNVPRALLFAVVLIGIVYVLSGYATAIGFGEHHVGALASNSSPLTTLATKFWGADGVWLITLTVLNSQFANVLCRLFGSGPDHLLVRPRGNLQPPARHHEPAGQPGPRLGLLHHLLRDRDVRPGRVDHPVRRVRLPRQHPGARHHRAVHPDEHRADRVLPAQLPGRVLAGPARPAAGTRQPAHAVADLRPAVADPAVALRPGAVPDPGVDSRRHRLLLLHPQQAHRHAGRNGPRLGA